MSEKKVKVPYGSPQSVLQYVSGWASEARRYGGSRSESAVASLRGLIDGNPDIKLTDRERVLVVDTIAAIEAQ